MTEKLLTGTLSLNTTNLKDFISIILVAPYDITRRGKVGRKFDISEKKKKRPEHQQAELDLSIVLMSVQGWK